MVPSKYLDLTGPQPRSGMASVRYRVLLPMAELASRGHHVTLTAVDEHDPAGSLGGLHGTDVVVLWKYAGMMGAEEKIVKAVRAAGASLAYDVCDDYSEQEEYRAAFLGTIREAEILIAASQPLADTIARMTGRAAAVISDPFEGPKGAAKWAPGADRLKLLWFGHWTNLDTIEAIVPRLLEFGAKRPLALTVVTIAQGNPWRQFKRFNLRHRDRLSMSYVEWSPQATWNALAAADLVLIPQRTRDRARSAKSPNRLVESMWAGRFVLASPIPAYAEFGAWAALHEDLCEGLEWVLGNQTALRQRILDAQAYIEAHYSSRVIADRWDKALNLGVS